MTPKQKPDRMPVKFGYVPPQLTTVDAWVVWRWECRDGSWTKPPFQIDGAPASTTDPKTWAGFFRVFQAYNTGKWDGIGLVMRKGAGIVGFDWDNCRDPETGVISQEILAQVKLLNTYTEISPSGTGLKSLCFGKLPGGGHHGPSVGVFNTGRYFCITGHLFDGVSAKIEKRRFHVERIVRTHWPADFDKKPVRRKPWDGDPLFKPTAAELLKRALNSRDTMFAKLWDGDTSGYPSHSEADLALLRRLAFWTGKDLDMMDTLFRQSGLYRDKWNRRNYRTRTLDAAVTGVTETFKCGPTVQINRKPTDENRNPRAQNIFD